MAAVDNRSSQKARGTSCFSRRFRANCRVDWQRGPSLPFMLTGKPTTSPPTSCPRMRASNDSASFVNFVRRRVRSEEHTSELQSLMRISYAVFCLKKIKTTNSSYYKPQSYYVKTT